MPQTAKNGSSRLRTRSRSGAVSSSTTTKPISAPVIRTCESRSEETPDARITFETVPLTAQSDAAPAAIA